MLRSFDGEFMIGAAPNNVARSLRMAGKLTSKRFHRANRNWRGHVEPWSGVPKGFQGNPS
jgi:hypothetical protein